MRKNTVTIGKEKFEVKPHSYRAMFMYEEMTEKSVAKIETLKDNITYLFCVLSASNKDFNYDFDGFVDALEESPELMAQLQAKLVGEKK